jgi:outer membrane protein TolC
VRPVQDLVAQAFQRRPELEAARIQLENSNIQLEGSRNALLPEVDIVGTIGAAGLAGQPNPLIPTTGSGSGGLVTPPTTATSGIGGTWTALGQLFGLSYPAYGVGLQLVLPLRNRVAQADYARDLITVRQTEIRRMQLENQVRLEIENALVILQRSRAALDAAIQSRMLQEQSLEIEQKKYAVGLSTNYLIMQYQSFVAQARSTEASTRGTYVKARNALERATGETLDNNHVSLDDAYRGQVSRPPDPIPAVLPPMVAPGPLLPSVGSSQQPPQFR